MKTTETTICPICQQRVSINPRTFTIRKHRVGGRGSDVCDGSGRLFLRPHNLTSTTSYTLYVNARPLMSGRGARPLISTSDRQYLAEVEANLKVEYEIHVEPLASVAETFNLPRSTPERLNLHWCYLPWWITSSSQGPLVRSRTCNNLVGIPSSSSSPQALVLRGVLKNFMSAVQADAFLEEEIAEALEQLESGSSPHAPLSISPRIAAQIINAVSATPTIPQYPETWALLRRDVWVLLSHNVISHDIDALRILRISDNLDQVESLLAHDPAHRAHLHQDLIEINHIRDLLNVYIMFQSC